MGFKLDTKQCKDIMNDSYTEVFIMELNTLITRLECAKLEDVQLLQGQIYMLKEVMALKCKAKGQLA